MSTRETWDAVDRYFGERLLEPDAALDAALQASEAAGLPAIQVASNQGKLLMLLAQTLGAKRILEIGTLGGYSTIWLARGLSEGGRLVTLELVPKHAEVARANLARAGVADRVEVRVGPALASLDALVSEGGEPFDLVFIDADKASTLDYFERAVKLSRPGALIVVDNVVRGGRVADLAHDSDDVRGIRSFAEAVKSDDRVSATAIQTVGAKGYDGLVVARVNGMKRLEEP